MSAVYRATYFGLVSKGGKPRLVRCVREGQLGSMHLVEQEPVNGTTYASWPEAEKDMEDRNRSVETVEIAGPPRPRLTVDQLRRSAS